MEAEAAVRARALPWRRGRHDPDAERVAAAQKNPTQFAALYDLYIDRIHDYVRVRISDRTVSEDVTSQIFMTALAQVRRFEVREGSSFAAWLFRIAHNAVQDVYRARPEPAASDDLIAGVVARLQREIDAP